MRCKYIFFLIPLIIILTLPLGYTQKEVTGKVITTDATAQMSLTATVVVPLSSITLISPRNNTYITNNSLVLNFTSNYTSSIWYNIDSIQNITISGSPIYFNTTQGPHKLFIFSNNTDGNVSSTNISFFTNLTLFQINYTRYTSPDAGNSTHLFEYSYEQLQNLTNIVFENTSSGKILFSRYLNLTPTSTGNVTPLSLLNIEPNVIIAPNFIEIKSANISTLNTSATLFLYGLSFTSVTLLRNGETCPSSVCTQESYSSGTLKFNVTGFSNYSAQETVSTSPPGSGGSGGGGGGGGGGGAAIMDNTAVIKNGEFMVEPSKLKVSLRQGEVKREKIRIKNNLTRKQKFSVKSLGLVDLVNIKETTFELAPGETKEINVDVIALDSTPADFYIGKIVIEGENNKEEVLMAIDVSSKNSLLDVKLEIPEGYQTIYPGDSILSNVNLFNLGQTGRVDVTIDYIVKDENGKEILTEESTQAVETQANILRRIVIPEDVKPGNYILYVKASYKVNNEETIASSTAWFDVLNKPKISLDNAIIGYLAGIILVIIILYLTINNRDKTPKEKISVKDLLKN